MKFEGKNHRVFEIEAFGQVRKLILCEAHYQGNDTLGVIAMELSPDGECVEEEFGVLTVNLSFPLDRYQSETRAFLKTYSENEGWALGLVEKYGLATPVPGVVANNGYVSLPLYEFNTNLFYEC